MTPATTMTLEVLDEARMTAETDAQIKRVLCECFSNDVAVFSQTRAWHGSDPIVTVIARDSREQIAGHMALHERQIDVGGTSVRVAGLQNVCIIPGHRKTGLLDRLMTATMAEASRREFDGGMLFCLPVLKRVYARLGWLELTGRMTTRIDETARETWLPNNDLPMYYPLKLAMLPPGNIHLHGNDW